MGETRDHQEMAEALEVLGMGEEEARIYLHLLQAGPSKVSQLAPYFDISRAKLYRLLDELSRKGFVSKTPERPTVYHPVFPENAFEIGRERLERRHDRFVSVREELLETLRRKHRMPGGPQPTDWDKIESIDRIHEAVQRTVAEAESSLWAASNHEASLSPRLPFVWDLWPIAEQKTEEGVDVRFLLGPTEQAFDNVPSWVLGQQEETRARRIDADSPVHFVLVDEEIVIFWVQTAQAIRGEAGGAGESVAVRTNAAGPVATHALLFEQLWAQAEAVASEAGDD